MPPSTIALTVAIVSLGVSAITLWLTLLHKGRIRMTHPTQVSFSRLGLNAEPQVFLRALVYCTSKRGRVIENMFVRLRRGESTQTLNVWVQGEDRLYRGSGMYVGPDGVLASHYFFPPRDGGALEFLGGRYILDVYATLVGVKSPVLLRTIALELTEPHSARLMQGDTSVVFDWGPDSQTYLAHTMEADSPAVRAVKQLREAIAVAPR